MTVKLSATSFGFTRPENADRGTIAMLPVSSSAPPTTVSTRPSAKTEPVNSVGSVPHVFGSRPDDTLIATRPPKAMYAPARKPATIIFPKVSLLLLSPTSIPAAVLARGSLNGTVLPPLEFCLTPLDLPVYPLANGPTPLTHHPRRRRRAARAGVLRGARVAVQHGPLDGRRLLPARRHGARGMEPRGARRGQHGRRPRRLGRRDA